MHVGIYAALKGVNERNRFGWVAGDIVLQPSHAVTGVRKMCTEHLTARTFFGLCQSAVFLAQRTSHVNVRVAQGIMHSVEMSHPARILKSLSRTSRHLLPSARHLHRHFSTWTSAPPMLTGIRSTTQCKTPLWGGSSGHLADPTPRTQDGGSRKVLGTCASVCSLRFSVSPLEQVSFRNYYS